MALYERKFLAHFIDASFGGEQTNYIRLGDDLEEYKEDLGPKIEVKNNIIGSQNIRHNGYEIKSEVNPYYAYAGDPLFEQLARIANERLTGEDCFTTKVDMLMDEEGNQVWAYREKVCVVPNSIGGNTSGVQIPFTVYNAGERVSGTFDLKTKTFTEGEAAN